MSRSATHLFRRACSLSRQDIWLLMQITAILLALPILLRTLSLPRLMRVLDPGPGTESKTPVDPAPILRLVQGLLDRGFGVFRANCVKQSLVLYRLLRKVGHGVVIRFGVAKKDGELAGHCWLELDGEPIVEQTDPRQSFAVIYTFPALAGDDRGGGELAKRSLRRFSAQE